MVSVGSVMMGCFDCLHATNVEKRDTVVGKGTIGRLHEFAFIALKWATSKPSIHFSLQAQCRTLHLYLGRYRMDVKGKLRFLGLRGYSTDVF